MHPSYRRRTVLVGGAVMLSLPGCLGGGAGSGPQERSYTLTLRRSGETVTMQVEPAGDVPDVIQINVGDTVSFMIVNEADVAVGVHNHATDAEIVVEPGENYEMTFEATEAMTGRQEIEGWPIESDRSDHTGEDHGEGTTVLGIIEVRPRGS